MSKKEATITIEPRVLRWAHKTRGISKEEVKKKFDKKKITLGEVEREEKKLNWSQLKQLAKIYKRSPGELLLDEPPNDEPMPEDFDFRTNNQKSIEPETRLAIRRAYRIQVLSNDLDRSLGHRLELENPVSLNTEESPEKEAQKIRKSFFSSIEEQIQWNNEKKDGKEALENWKKSIEKTGILVLEKSLTKNLEDISGLSLASYPPVILLNYKHTAYRKIFTLFHEYAHILFRQKNQNSLCSIDLANQNKPNEKKADSFSAEFLLPFSEIQKNKALFNMENLKAEKLKKTLKRASEQYKVSRAVILRRLYDLKKIDDSIYKEINTELNERYHKQINKKGGGGGNGRDWVQEKFRENGFSFTKKVVEAHHSEAITFYSALAYLDLKSKYWKDMEKFVLTKS